MLNFPVTFFSDINAPPPPYTANASDFNGSSSLGRGADYTGNSDSRTGIFSAWVRLDGDDGTTRYIIANSIGTVEIYRDATNKFHIDLLGATETFSFKTVNTYVASATWLNILASWDTNFSAGNKISNLLINGTSDKTVNSDSNAAFNIDYTASDQFLSLSSAGSDRFNGCISEVYFAPGQFLDFTNPTNVAKFISGGKPVTLGSNGAMPTGVAPILYLRNPAASIGNNSGTGGNMAPAGTIVDCSTSPSD